MERSCWSQKRDSSEKRHRKSGTSRARDSAETIFASLARFHIHSGLCGIVCSSGRSVPELLFSATLLLNGYFCLDIPVYEDQIKALNLLIVQLPDNNCQTLRVLLRFLTEVADHSSKNRMTVNNIATVMGPSLFPPRISTGPRINLRSRNTMDTLNEGVYNNFQKEIHYLNVCAE